MKFKLVLSDSSIRVLPPVGSYEALLAAVKAVGSVRGSPRLFYYDEDGDKISLTNEGDFEALKGTQASVKLMIEGMDQSVVSVSNSEINASQLTETITKLSQKIEQLAVGDRERSRSNRHHKRRHHRDSEEECERGPREWKRGRGKFWEKKKELIDSCVEQKIKEMVPEIARQVAKMMRVTVAEQPSVQPEPIAEERPAKQKPAQERHERLVHYGVTCDGCKKRNFQGIRYKCTQCPDFDFCQVCKANESHPHAFREITKVQGPCKFMNKVGKWLERNGNKVPNQLICNIGQFLGKFVEKVEVVQETKPQDEADVEVKAQMLAEMGFDPESIIKLRPLLHSKSIEEIIKQFT